MKRDPITLIGPAIGLIVSGMFFLSAARYTLKAYLLSQQTEPVIPGHIIELVLACMAFVALGSFLLGMIQGRKTRH